MNKPAIKLLAIDIAKNEFHLHSNDEHGKVVLKRQVTRAKLAETVQNMHPAESSWRHAVVPITGPGGSRRWAMTTIRQDIRQVEQKRP